MSSMLVSIPVIHEKKWYINFHCTFFRFAQWTQWRTVKIHQLFSHRFYWLKSDSNQTVVLESAQSFFASPCAILHVQTSRWKKVANKFIGANLYYVTSKFFNVPAKNSFPILTFIPIYWRAMLHSLLKIREKNCLDVGRNVTSCMLLCIIQLLHAVHTSSGHLDTFCTHYIYCAYHRTLCSFACNKLEVSWRK